MFRFKKYRSFLPYKVKKIELYNYQIETVIKNNRIYTILQEAGEFNKTNSKNQQPMKS
jgi:hypothetical protein